MLHATRGEVPHRDLRILLVGIRNSQHLVVDPEHVWSLAEEPSCIFLVRPIEIVRQRDAIRFFSDLLKSAYRERIEIRGMSDVFLPAVRNFFLRLTIRFPRDQLPVRDAPELSRDSYR